MRLGVAALVVVQLCLASLSSCEPQLVSSVAGKVADAAAYGAALVVALANGTIIYVEDGVRWVSHTGTHGTPVAVEPAYPYGILVLTSRGWLGLLSPMSGEATWCELRVDVNAIKRGEYSIAYANGVVAVLVGRNVVFKALPSLEDAGPRDHVLNRYVKCLLSRNATLALLLGINTFCHICLENDERLLVIRRVGSRTYLVKAEVERVKDVGVDENFSTIYIARWGKLAIYRVGGDGLTVVSNVTFPHRAGEWRSYGFSPGAKFFHYTYLEGGKLMLMLVDISHRNFKRYSLATAPSGAVHSLVDDEGRVLVLLGDPVSRNTTLLYLDPATGARWLGSWRGFARMKLAGDYVVVITANEASLLRLRGVEPEAKPLSLTVKVVDDEGAPIPGALISINSTPLARTSEDGIAVMTLEPGLYVVEVSSPSHKPSRAMLSLSESTSLTVRLERLYLLEVMGIFDNGTVPPLCHIAVLRDGEVLWSGEAVNCRALLNVTRGNYTVSVRAGGELAEGSWAVEQDTRAVVTLRGTYRVAIRVSGEEGVEVENATVIVEAEDGEVLAESRGAECVFNLPTGTYRVIVSAPGYNQTALLLKVDKQLEVRAVLKRIEVSVGQEEGEQGSPPPSWLAALCAGLAVATAGLLAFSLLRRRRHTASPAVKPHPQTREK